MGRVARGGRVYGRCFGASPAAPAPACVAAAVAREGEGGVRPAFEGVCRRVQPWQAA